MDIFAKLVLSLHVLGLVIGMGSGMANSRIGPFIGGGSDEQKQVLFKLAKTLGKSGHIGLGILWITGIALIFLRGWDFGSLSVWFWLKMLFVLVLSASVGMGGAAFRRFVAGDVAASTRVAMMSKVSMISGVLVIITAIFAFQ